MRRRRRKKQLSGKTLQYIFEFDVRFSEVDSMGVVWHGNYIRYFEDGREAWGRHYGMTYLDVYNNGYFTPIVKIECEHLRPLCYGDKAIVQVTYVDMIAAKLFYEYKVLRAKDNALAAVGQSTQVFLDQNRELCITLPDFVETWKKKWELL